MFIHDRIDAQLPVWRERVGRLTKEYGQLKVCDVTVGQIYGGIRDVQIQVSDISYVEPYQGLRLRGYTVHELLERLPRAPGSEVPLAGGLYYLLLVDALPTLEDAMAVEEEWRSRSEMPPHVYNMIRSLPVSAHPMTMFSAGILALQTESIFAQKYTDGVTKPDYWKYYVDDSMNLVAKLPGLAAFIYNYKYQNGLSVPPDPNLDWAASFAHLIGKGDSEEYKELCRFFFFLHSDHEGGNVSAHASHLVCSALSDVYFTCSAGMDGLAGPLHGLANQECLRWLLGVRDHFGELPSRDELRDYLEDQVGHGKVIPGYGHAVLRVTDPRFVVQYDFAKKYLLDDELFDLVRMVYEVLPPILNSTGKIKNPWPNVDAINGALQYHYGITQFDFYTVLFGVSRILGLTAHAVWSRALGKPIERPKSLTTPMLEDMVNKAHLVLSV